MKHKFTYQSEFRSLTRHDNGISAKPEDDEELDAGGGVPVPPKPK